MYAHHVHSLATVYERVRIRLMAAFAGTYGYSPSAPNARSAGINNWRNKIREGRVKR